MYKKTAKIVNGDIILIQDADLEYNPNDYIKLIDPILKRKTNVVYGSRVLGKKDIQIKILHYPKNICKSHF